MNPSTLVPQPRLSAANSLDLGDFVPLSASVNQLHISQFGGIGGSVDPQSLPNWTMASAAWTPSVVPSADGGAASEPWSVPPPNGTASMAPSSVGSLASTDVYNRRLQMGLALNRERGARWQQYAPWVRVTPPLASGMTTPPLSNHISGPSAHFSLPSHRVHGYYVPEWSAWLNHTPSFSEDPRGTFTREYESPTSFSDVQGPSVSQAELEDIVAYSQARVAAYVDTAEHNGLL